MAGSLSPNKTRLSSPGWRRSDVAEDGRGDSEISSSTTRILWYVMHLKSPKDYSEVERRRRKKWLLLCTSGYVGRQRKVRTENFSRRPGSRWGPSGAIGLRGSSPASRFEHQSHPSPRAPSHWHLFTVSIITIHESQEQAENTVSGWFASDFFGSFSIFALLPFSYNIFIGTDMAALLGLVNLILRLALLDLPRFC